jgi:hypothetical protein
MTDFLTIALPTILFFVTPIIVVWLWLRFTSQKEKARIRLIEKALECNKDFNLELLIKPQKDVVANNRRLLVSGIALACLGLALFVVLLILTDISYASLALLALLPGVGFLMAYRLIARDLKRGK